MKKDKKWVLIPGRFQTFHEGHKWLIQQILDQDKNALIAIRNVAQDENNPRGARQVYDEMINYYKKEYSDGRVYFLMIPDIEELAYGRDVGYKITEYTPPKEIADISGTEIRKAQK